MKLATTTLALATAFLLAVSSSSFDFATAAECTAEQLLKNAEIRTTIVSASECKVFASGSATQAEICANTKCLETTKKGVAQLEDCTTAGTSIKETLEVGLGLCKSSSSTITTTAPASTTAAGSSTSKTTTPAASTPTPTSSSATTTTTSVLTVAATSIAAVFALSM